VSRPTPGEPGSFLRVCESGVRHFDESWVCFPEQGCAVMTSRRGRFRLRNNGGSVLVLDLLGSHAREPRPRRGSVLLGGARLGRFRLEKGGLVRKYFRFDPVPEKVLEVEIRTDRLLAPPAWYPVGPGPYGLGIYEARVLHPRLPCMEPWVTMFVTWDGRVRTCCMSDRDVGHLGRKPLEEIWNGPELAEMRRGMATGVVPPECGQCLENHRQKFELEGAGRELGVHPEACRDLHPPAEDRG
jgi:hypothetical protein